MMKTKRFCKSTVSLLLVFMMLISMLTVGIVNTSAAEVEAVDTGAGTTTIYFANSDNWDVVTVQYYGGSAEAQWPGAQMTKTNDTYNGHAVYTITLPDDTTTMIINNNGNGKQTVSITSIEDGKIYCLGALSGGQYSCEAKDYTTGGDSGDDEETTGGATVSDVTLRGSFNDWEDNDQFLNTNEENIVTITKQFAAGDYKFKILNGETWLGNSGTITDTTSASSVGWKFDSTSDCNFKVTHNNYYYTFTFNKSTNYLFVTYSQYKPFTNGATLYLEPTTSWDKDGAWFAAKFFNSASGSKVPEKYVRATECGDTNNHYEIVVPGGSYDTMVWYRMDPNETALDSASSWNNTMNLNRSGDNNCFEITAKDDSSNDYKGNWKTCVLTHVSNVVLNYTKISETEYEFWPTADVLLGEDPVAPEDYLYYLYIDGEYISHNIGSETLKVDLTDGEHSVYIIVCIEEIEDVEKPEESKDGVPSETLTITVEGGGEDEINYTFENIDFTYEFDPNEPQRIHVTPNDDIKVYNNDEDVTANVIGSLKYKLVINGAIGEANAYSGISSGLLELGSNEVYIIVYVEGDSNEGTSVEKYITPDVVIPDVVTLTIKFKSSSAYRYQPKITVGEYTDEPMSIYDTNPIGWNPTKTQSYYWYEFQVTVSSSEDLTITFKNAYRMNASITLTAGTFNNGDYYFGVNNMNGPDSTVHNLTTYYNNNNEGILNFVKSAAHMVANDAEKPGLATTSVKGRVCVLGDANQDDSLNIMDATTIQLALVRKIDLDDTAVQLADFNLSENLSISDVTGIQTYLVQ